MSLPAPTLNELLARVSSSVHGQTTLLTVYPPGWEHAGGGGYVDRALLHGGANPTPGAAVSVRSITNRLAADGPATPDSALTSIPLQIKRSRVLSARTLTRMATTLEPYPVAKLRVFAREWKNAIRQLQLVQPPVIASSFPALLLCHDAAVRPQAYIAFNCEWLVLRAHSSRLISWSWRRQRAMEIDLLSAPHQIFALSELDAQRLADLSGRSVTPVSWMLPPIARTKANRRGTLRIGYLGSASWPPNATDIQKLCSEILPEVLISRPEAELVLAGRGTELVKPRRGVTRLGPVDDLTNFYDRIDVVVVPRSDDSTGVSIKVVEALQREVPVISTTAVAEALGSPQGIKCANSSSELIQRLLEH